MFTTTQTVNRFVDNLPRQSIANGHWQAPKLLAWDMHMQELRQDLWHAYCRGEYSKNYAKDDGMRIAWGMWCRGWAKFMGTHLPTNHTINS